MRIWRYDVNMVLLIAKKKLEEGGHWYVGKFEFSPKGSIKLSKKEKNRED